MKLNINSAKKGNSDYTFSPISLVSMDFGRLQPVMSWSTLIGDKFPSVRGKGLLRCTPQVFPPFGRMNLKSASFLVPDSQIYSWSSAFHSDNKLWRGQLADSVPVFYSTDLNKYFVPGSNTILGSLSTAVASNPSTPPAFGTYDFSYPSSTRTSGNTNLVYYKLTTLGWKIYAMFKGLGYDFITFPTDTGAGSQASHISANASYISAVPFLAYCKIWNDFFCNSYMSDRTVVAEYLQKIYLNKDVVVSGTTRYDSTNFHVDFLLFFIILADYLSLPYESNLYTNAWNSVNDPTGTLNSTLNQVNSQSLISPFGRSVDGEFASLEVGSAGTSHSDLNTSHVGNKTWFSELGHKTLESFDKFVRRRNLVGSKAVQQLYALFGVEPDEWKKDYVVKLSENSNRVIFSAITSQSDTDTGSSGKPLGAFAGTGLGGFDISFSYESNTYGTIICLAWLNIDPILMHGMNPDVLRVKPLDFYNPDFDGKAYRPIPYCEVTGGKAVDQNSKSAISVYGYTNMYDDYRNIRDVVAGTFCDETTQHFAFMRDLTRTRNRFTGAGVDMLPQTQLVQ